MPAQPYYAPMPARPYYDEEMLRVKLLEAGARLPVVAHPGEDLGYDIFALVGYTWRRGLRCGCGRASRSRLGILRRARRWDFLCGTARRWRRGGLPRLQG